MIKVILLFIFCISFCVKAADQNDFKANISFAQKIGSDTLAKQDLNFANLQVDEMQIFKRYQEKFRDELEHLNIRFISNNETAFLHFGQRTWIETDIAKNGEVRIDPRFVSNKFRLSQLMHFLGHEVAHHLLSAESSVASAEIESKCWKIAGIFLKVILYNQKYPELLESAIGTFNSSKQGCHDQINILNMDLEKGIINARFTTSKGHCRINEDFMQRYFKSQNLFDFLRLKKSDQYVFDTIEMKLNCSERWQGNLICRDLRPKKTNKYCEVYLDKHEQLASFGLMFNKENIIDVERTWCVEVGLKYIGYISEKNSYAQGIPMVALSDAEIIENDKLNKKGNFLGKLLLLRQAITADKVDIETGPVEDL